MEKLKAKHDHKLTDILKVAIFGIFLLLPFMVYAPNALYYGVNEYAVAQEVTKEEPKYYESNEVNNATDIQTNKIYYFVDDIDISNVPNLLFVGKLNYDLVINQNEVPNNIPQNSNAYLYCQPNYFRIYFRQNVSDTSQIYCQFNHPQNFVFEEIYSSQFIDFIYSYCEYTDYKFIKEYEPITYTMSISDSMYNSWQLMWETPMFKWTSESVLKQGLDNFTGVFGVSDTSYFTNLIVYELIMVAIYIVIDIVLTLFKWLTHLIGEK